MNALILSVLCSSGLFIIFKYFEKFKVNTLHAIIVNYIVAGTCGLIDYGKPISPASIIHYDWFIFSLILGLVFISTFNIMGITAQKHGLSVVAVMSKMSVIIPIIVGILLYNENLGIYKIIGILIALVSIYLVSTKPTNKTSNGNILFPILVFLGGGFIDSFLKYIQTNYVSENEIPIFSASLFFIAFGFGMLIIIYQAIKGNLEVHLRNIIGGVILGVVNYFSIYYLIKVIGNPNFDSSTIFTLNNVSILISTTVLGWIIFKEKLSKTNKLGIAMACIGLVLVSIEL